MNRRKNLVIALLISALVLIGLMLGLQGGARTTAAASAPEKIENSLAVADLLNL